ncbi:hypothetical protein HOM50_04330 [bacterium]|jgi:hypothetical protein|nr:hypothetical protein [bacterium]MBT5015606.1 hypothetical protein [bacterium]
MKSHLVVIFFLAINIQPMAITFEEECVGRVLQQQPYDRREGPWSVPTLHSYKILFAKRNLFSDPSSVPQSSLPYGRVWTASPSGNSFRVKDNPEIEWNSEDAKPLGTHTRIPKTIWLDNKIQRIERIKEFPHMIWVFMTKGNMMMIPDDPHKPFAFRRPTDLFIYEVESN